MSKLSLKETYAVESKYEAYFTGKRIQITKDGGSLLCECENSVGVVAVETGKVTNKISCEQDKVTSIALAPDDSSLIVALSSTTIQQYLWPDLELQRSFRSYHKSPITVMNWDASSSLLITGAGDSSARVWDLQQKFCTHSLKGAEGVFGAVMFYPDLIQKPHVYGAVNNTIYIWALAAGSSEIIASLKGHHSVVTSIELTSNNTQLVSTSFDRVIILWDLVKNESIRVVPVLESLSGMLLQPKDLLFPGAKVNDHHVYALVVGDKGIPSVWQVDTGRQVWKASKPLLSAPADGGVALINQLSYSPTLESVIYTTFDHSILFAKINTLDIWKQLSGYNDQILDTVFVGKGDSHIVVATNSAEIRVYNVENFSCCLLQGHTENVYSVSRHPTKLNIFASSAHDNTARLWRLKKDGSAVCIGLAAGHTRSIGCVTLSEAFMITGSHDMCLKRWNISAIVEKNKGSEMITIGSTNTEKAHDKDINDVCVSVNHKLIASGSEDRTAKVWDSSNLSLLGVLRGHRRSVWSVHFSPVDEILATSSADGTIKIWALNDFSNALTLEGHAASVMKLSWVSQGQQLLSIGSDGLLKLWTLKTRQCVQTNDEHENRLWALAVSQDETKLFTGGEDATLIMWKDTTQEEKDKIVEEKARLAAQEQTLSNLIQDKKWGKALGIAIRLNKPFRALKIVKEMLYDNTDELPKILKRFRHDQLVTFLQFVMQWNTKSKTAKEAQVVLNIVLSSKTPEELEEIREWRQILEGLAPYTERHLKRLSALHQSSFIMQYMATSLSLTDSVPLGSETKPLDDLALLKSIRKSPLSEDEGVDVNEGTDEDEDDIRDAIKASVMEVSENDMSDISEDDEEDEETDESEDDDGDDSSSTIKDKGQTKSAPPLISQDDLDANFLIEKVEARSSDSEDALEYEERDNMMDCTHLPEKTETLKNKGRRKKKITKC